MLCIIALLVMVGQGVAAEHSTQVKAALGDLRAVGVVVDVAARGFNGVTEAQVKNALIAALKSKIPRLRIADDSESLPWIHISVDLMPVSGGYAGTAHMEVYRLCRVVESQREVWAVVWQKGVIFTGPPGSQTDNVAQHVGILVTDLAADY